MTNPMTLPNANPISSHTRRLHRLVQSLGLESAIIARAQVGRVISDLGIGSLLS